ncbi:MAG: polyprenyl diphosphate synthase [Candidatus Sulfomarinibacteraceae bacterium]
MITTNLRHVAIIMDGNGRWAQERGLPRLEGHRGGARAVRNVVTHCRESGLRFLTLYAFSMENWSRPTHEVEGLMRLLVRFLAERGRELAENGIQLRTIGDIGRLPRQARSLLDRVIASTRELDGMRLSLALSYGGRDEIVRAARRLAARAMGGELDAGAVDEELFADELDTRDTPPVDLVIRTGGESRLSNFLLWQSAYDELYFTDRRWPDFTAEDFDRAVAWYHDRNRTYGLVEAVG